MRWREMEKDIIESLNEKIKDKDKLIEELRQAIRDMLVKVKE